jgi:hypothetical protein
MQTGLCLDISGPKNASKMVGAVKTHLFFAVGDKVL